MQGPFGIRSLALTGLFILAAFYTLYFGRAFFLPIVLALLLNFLLSPVVRGLKKLRIPNGARGRPGGLRAARRAGAGASTSCRAGL